MEPVFIVVDLFCGAGGTTTGFVQAELEGNGIAQVVACVNHDPLAIKSHWANHPEVKHFEEDIRTLNLTELMTLVRRYRELYPNAKLILWASLECTNFSKAKGGQPRDADSRTLANSLYQVWDNEDGKYIDGDSYIQLLDPDYIQIENVVEFMSWGPLRIKCKKKHKNKSDLMTGRNKKTGKKEYKWEPESRKNGQDWMRWRQAICNLGYTDKWVELNSANFGAHTSRNRLFGVFARPGLPIVFPTSTHAKNPPERSLFDTVQKWKAVKEVLDFRDEGISIFGRKKPLSDKTLERIYAGLLKYVAKGDKAFISKYFSGRPKGKVNSVEQPAPTVTTFGGNSLIQTKTFSDCSIDGPIGAVTTIDHHAVVCPISILKYNSVNQQTGKHDPPSLEDPSPVVSTHGRLGLIQGEFIVQRNSGNPESKIVDVDGPARTITGTGGNQDLVQPEFLTHYYSNGGEHSSIEKPCPTITAKARSALVQPKYFIEKSYSGYKNNQSIDQPAGTVMSNDKHRLVQCDSFIMPTNYDNKPKSLDEPLQVITANRKHHYLVNPSHGGHCSSVDAPCPVIVARQDKAPLRIVQAVEGRVAIAVYEEDTEICIKIKEFMVIYGLIDIKMRMLRVHELLKIQGFPEQYRLEGSQADQKKFIGNSVVPQVVKVWTEALGANLIDRLKSKAA